MAHTIPAERVFRNENRARMLAKFMPPLGPRDRDDYVFALPDGGYSSVTLDLLGEGAERVRLEVWITGFESPARQSIVREDAPTAGPLLPPHPYGFARCLRL